jgi:hypothetical protein
MPDILSHMYFQGDTIGAGDCVSDGVRRRLGVHADHRCVEGVGARSGQSGSIAREGRLLDVYQPSSRQARFKRRGKHDTKTEEDSRGEKSGTF